MTGAAQRAMSKDIGTSRRRPVRARLVSYPHSHTPRLPCQHSIDVQSAGSAATLHLHGSHAGLCHPSVWSVVRITDHFD